MTHREYNFSLQDEEYNRFALNCKDDIQIFRECMKGRSSFNPSMHCIRGLESRVSFGGREEIVNLRRLVVDAVLAEQDLQFEMDGPGSINSASLAFISRAFTKESQRKAAVRGETCAGEVCFDNDAFHAEAVIRRLKAEGMIADAQLMISSHKAIKEHFEARNGHRKFPSLEVRSYNYQPRTLLLKSLPLSASNAIEA